MMFIWNNWSLFIDFENIFYYDSVSTIYGGVFYSLMDIFLLWYSFRPGDLAAFTGDGDDSYVSYKNFKWPGSGSVIGDEPSISKLDQDAS